MINNYERIIINFNKFKNFSTVIFNFYISNAHNKFA